MNAILPHPAQTDRLRLVVIAGILSAAAYVGVGVLSGHFLYGHDQTARPIPAVLGLFAAAFACYLVAIWAAVRSSDTRRLLGWIVVGSVVFRVILLFSWPIQEIDIYRYLWDGQASIQGVSPFHYSPLQVRNAEADDDALPDDLRRLVEARDASPAVATILERVHYEELPTVYPPVSQAVFAASAAVTPNWATVFERLAMMKVFFILFDLATLALVFRLVRRMGLHTGWILAYGWCPLLIKETANSGHLDAVAVFLAMAALVVAVEAFYGSSTGTRGRPTVAAVLLALAVGAKLYPVVFAPLLVVTSVRRLGWRKTIVPTAAFVLVTVVVLWPMLGPNGSMVDSQDSSQGLKAFLGRWEMNDLLFMLVLENVKPDGDRAASSRAWFAVVPDTWRVGVTHAISERAGVSPKKAAFLITRAGTSLLFLAFAVFLAGRAASSESPQRWLEAAFLTIAWFWLLSPTQNPWYWAWAMPLVVFARSRVWLLLSGLTMIYYLRFWLGYHWPDEPVAYSCYAGNNFFDYIIVCLEFGPWFLLLTWIAVVRWRFVRPEQGKRTECPSVLRPRVPRFHPK